MNREGRRCFAPEVPKTNFTEVCMATSETVKRELRDIRYYYLRKAELDEAFETLGVSPFKQTVERYKNAIREAPLRL